MVSVYYMLSYFTLVSNIIILHFEQLQASLVLIHLHIIMQIITGLLPANRSTLPISGTKDTPCSMLTKVFGQVACRVVQKFLGLVVLKGVGKR